MTDEYKTLAVEKKGGLATVTMNRPDKLNALSMQLIYDLLDCFTRMCSDYKSRVIILRGAGRAFCAGADLQQLNEGFFTRDSKEPLEEMGPVQFHYYKAQSVLSDIVLKMRRCPQPIIGAVRGHAVGGGFSLALACDVRILSETARMNAGYIRIGLSGCDMGSSYFLPRIIGFSRAAEYLYTGRVMDASTADRLGLASKVVPDGQLEAVAQELAEEMLQNSPAGLRMTKEAFNLNVDAPSLESAVNIENRNQSLLSFTEDHREGGAAMYERRKPNYHDR